MGPLATSGNRSFVRTISIVVLSNMPFMKEEKHCGIKSATLAFFFYKMTIEICWF